MKQRVDIHRHLTALEQWVSLDPGCGEAWGRLGLVQSLVGRYERAAESLEKALGLDPAPAVFWHGLGVALKELGRFQEALPAACRAVELAPTQPEAWELLGTATALLGRHREGAEHLREAERIGGTRAARRGPHRNGPCMRSVGRALAGTTCLTPPRGVGDVGLVAGDQVDVQGGGHFLPRGWAASTLPPDN